MKGGGKEKGEGGKQVIIIFGQNETNSDSDPLFVW